VERAKKIAMKAMRLLLTCALLLSLGATAFAAEDLSAGASTGGAPKAGTDDQGKPTEPAECPIKKTIDGKIYCFQNDPALSKPQGGS
jgi:hypothetical protein